MKDAIWINEYFRLALEASPSGQLIVDKQGYIRHVNNKIADIFGYAPNEIKEQPIEMLVPLDMRDKHPDFRDHYFHKPVVRDMGSGQILFGLHKTGGKIPVEIGLNPLLDHGEEFVLASIVDISERVKSERQFQLALEASPSGLLLINDAGKIVLVNSKIEEIFGYYRDELINNSIGMLVPETYRERHPEFVHQFLSTPKARSMGVGRDLYGLRKDGTEVPVEIGLNPLEIESRVHVLASVVDITERKQTEIDRQRLNNQIQHAQRMESLGILAGGTAHDFNNILSAISGNAELVMMSLPNSVQNKHKLQTYLENIVNSCKRAAGLTNQMLAYAGKATIQVEDAYLNDIISGILDLLGSSLPKKIQLSTNFQTELSPIVVDRSQIEQVAMNLVTNASEAIGDKSGQIRISTGSEYLDNKALKLYKSFDYLDEGEYQYILIEDNGCGMPKEVVDNMFDPFYTTKFTGRGLGMASVLGIIRSHFGSICVDSKLNSGTSIKIIFPAKLHSNQKTDTNEDADVKRWRALIVDDEKDVRDILIEILNLNGFDVVSASNGQEALATIVNDGKAFDLIVLDMNMPGMSGFELYDELISMHYRSKVIMVSGYSEQHVNSLIQRDADNGNHLITSFLHKPFEFKLLQLEIDKLFEKETTQD